MSSSGDCNCRNGCSFGGGKRVGSSHAMGNGSIIGGCSRYQSRSHNGGSCDSTDSTGFLR